MMQWRREEEEEEEGGLYRLVGWWGLATLRDPDGYSSYKQPSRPNLKSSERALSVSEISPNSHSIHKPSPVQRTRFALESTARIRGLSRGGGLRTTRDERRK